MGWRNGRKIRDGRTCTNREPAAFRLSDFSRQWRHLPAPTYFCFFRGFTASAFAGYYSWSTRLPQTEFLFRKKPRRSSSSRCRQGDSSKGGRGVIVTRFNAAQVSHFRLVPALPPYQVLYQERKGIEGQKGGEAQGENERQDDFAQFTSGDFVVFGELSVNSRCC